MKLAILAALLLIAVASLVSGAPAEIGKSRYGEEICLAAIFVVTTYGGTQVKLQAF
jgi:hypothetical protein